MHISINNQGNIELDSNYRSINIESVANRTYELADRVKKLIQSEHQENLANLKNYHTNITLLNDILTNFEIVLERVH